MAKVLNFNVVAVSLLDNQPKARVRFNEKLGLLQVRPGNRANVASLPKTEDVRPLRVRMENGRVKGAQLNLKGFDQAEVGNAFNVVPGKYGWLNLVPVQEPGRGTAFARVGAK